MRRRILLTGMRIIMRAKRRAATFVILFTFISGLMLFSLNFVHDARTTTLLVDSKGVILVPKGSLFLPYDERLVSDLKNTAGVERVIPIWFVNLSEVPELGINVILIAVDPENKWCYKISEGFDLTPASLVEGNYISREGEILLSSKNVLKISEGANVTLGVLSVLSIANRRFRVVGIFSETKVPEGGANWVVMHENDVVRICEKYGLHRYVFGYVVIVSGWLFNEWENVESVGKVLENKEELRNFTVKYRRVEDNYRIFSPMIVLFAFSTFGCLIIGSIFSYLDLRLRKRSLAILRSIGWSTADLRLLVLSELLLVVLLGFFSGLFALAIYRLFTAQVYIPLSAETVLISLIILLVSTQVPGGYLYQRSITKVKPVDALRLVER